MVRRLAPSALGPSLGLAAALLALAACDRGAARKSEAAASSAPAAAAASSAAPAASGQAAAPAHNYSFREGDEYAYLPKGHGEAGADATPARIRYLGEQNGLYAVAQVENGAIVVASCSAPCTEVRLQGQGLDQTAPLSGDSIIHAALSDAMNGQLEVWRPPAAAGKK